MATKSSFILAVLFIANPIMLLFFQNCSVMPHPQATSTQSPKTHVQAETKELVKNN